MPYTGPGPAIVGQAEYDKAVQRYNDSAGGLIGSAVLDPMPIADNIYVQPDDPKPETPEPVSFVTMHVMSAKKLIDTATREECARWLVDEQARATGPRPTLIAALEARLA